MMTARRQRRGQPAHVGGISPCARLAAGCLVLLSLAASLTCPALADDPRLHVEVNRTDVSAGGVIRLTVVLEGFSRRASEPQISPPEGFEIYDSGRSTNISWVNGKLSSSTQYTYQLVPTKPGTYQLGPVTVEDKGRTHRSQLLELRVTREESAERAELD